MGRITIREKEVVDASDIVKAVSNTVIGYPHLSTIVARQDKDSIRLIYLFDDLNGRTKIVETSVPLKGSIQSISGVVHGAYIYEMEVRDLFGVNFENHPVPASRLLLPECYPGDAPPPMLKEVKAEELRKMVTERCLDRRCMPSDTGAAFRYSAENFLILPFGPYHPALKEPEFFMLVLEGEKIVDAVPRIGFVHRGIEKLAETRNFLHDLFLVERICGICSFSHSWAFMLALENLLGINPNTRAEYLRTLVAELERIHSHLLWLGLLGYWTGFESMFMWIWGARERIMKLIELITGNRVHKSFITVGGTRRDVEKEKLDIVVRELKVFEKEFKKISEEVLSYEPLIERIRMIGEFTADKAVKTGAVGPLLRSVGIPFDIRKVEPYGAYGDVDFKVVTSKKGDAYNVAIVRLEEVFESIRIVEQVFEKIPSGNPVPQAFFLGNVKEGESIGRVEAPRGELVYYLKSNNTRNPERLKIRTPTLPNLALAAEVLKGHTLSDVPIVITMIDPCFSCEDRGIFIDVSSGRPRCYYLNIRELK
ncbi:hydrogenase large subunit [Thermogladius sp. 4427co]|uniref:hydrogenase large subunit n=1 Tax=Thermogladius sp. 4427co TaxID=3450718 RepID=UPI003F78ECE6